MTLFKSRCHSKALYNASQHSSIHWWQLVQAGGRGCQAMPQAMQGAICSSRTIHIHMHGYQEQCGVQYTWTRSEGSKHRPSGQWRRSRHRSLWSGVWLWWRGLVSSDVIKWPFRGESCVNLIIETTHILITLSPLLFISQCAKPDSSFCPFQTYVSYSTPLNTLPIHFILSTYYNFVAVCPFHLKLSILYIENMARIVSIITWTHKVTTLRHYKSKTTVHIFCWSTHKSRTTRVRTKYSQQAFVLSKYMWHITWKIQNRSTWIVCSFLVKIYELMYAVFVLGWASSQSWVWRAESLNWNHSPI